MSKKKAFIFMVIFVLMVVLAAIFYTSSVKRTNENQGISELEPVKITKGKLNIMVDPRIELLSSVQINSAYPLLTKLDFSYRRNMEKYFDDFKNHEAVRMFSRLSRNGFSYDAPPTLMLHLTNPPELKKVIPYMDNIRYRGADDNEMDDFVSKLQKYSVDTNFQKFYNNNMDFYNKLVKKVSDDIKDFDFVNDLEEYYGIKKNSYNIILAPLFHPGGYGPQIRRDDGTYDVYGIIGPINVEDGLPLFPKDAIRGLVWHEFGHSFVNPISSKYANELDKYSKLYELISGYMQSQAYTNWMICVNEHIVRAVTTRLTYIKLGKEVGDRVLQYEKNNGFFYIEPLLERLKIYEENRDKYATFEDFYPELIEVFKELSQKNLGEDFYSLKFEGPINSIWSMYFATKKKVLIVPTNEKYDLIESKILSYVKEIRDKALKDALILTDEEALNRDLSDYNIIAFGTMDGNLWLSKYKSEFPFRIEPDRIIADTEYKGKNLRFISALPNPQNPHRALIIYTALKAEDVLNVHEISYDITGRVITGGNTDYVIADGKKELKSGNYVKENGKWTFR